MARTNSAVAACRGVPVSFVTVMVLTLAMAQLTCNAFGLTPLPRIHSHRTNLVRNRISVRGKLPSLGSALQSATVDQEPGDHENSVGASIHNNIYSEQSKLPRNAILDRLEEWCLDRLADGYSYTERHVKCPFFRRRYADALDHVEKFVRFVVVRPRFREEEDSSKRLGPPLSCQSVAGQPAKTKHLPIGKLLEVLRRDWRAHGRAWNQKGYYITGRMSTQIYRDDCEFQSPDPDLPLKGLRKYTGVASHLFDAKASHSRLFSLDEYSLKGHSGRVLRAEWSLSLVLHLPWKPRLAEFTGSTLYFLDRDHLIFRHQETWDISVRDAFLGMMSLPQNPEDTTTTTTSGCPLTSWLAQNLPSHTLPSEDSSESPVPTKASTSLESGTFIRDTSVEEEISVGH